MSTRVLPCAVADVDPPTTASVPCTPTAASSVRATGSAPSNYVGDGTGLVTRTDLGGLNLSTVPKVFIECGNMRDSKDASLLTSGTWRQKAARGISDGITSFLKN